MLQTQHLIKRELYMQQLRSLKDQNIIKVITGVRRCGKSTLMLMFADEIISQGAREQQVQIYNFEDLDTLSLGIYTGFISISRSVWSKMEPIIFFWMRYKISLISND
mgnify:CR=1 FL=1